MAYKDIPYRIEREAHLPPCEFLTIWKVLANDAYHGVKRAGFASPGLFITYEGNGLLTQAGEQHLLLPGSYFFVQEGIPCTYCCQENDWKFYFVDFTTLDMPRYLQLPVGEAAATCKLTEALRLCELLIENLIEQPLGHIYSAHILLQQLILLFAREQSIATASRHTELNQILVFLHRNLDRPLRVEELVLMSGLSRTTFFTRFRSVTGLSPSEYMLRLKLESARVTLETTSLSVKEIAARLHFYDEFHFSKRFKSTFGISPSAFRRLCDSHEKNPATSMDV